MQAEKVFRGGVKYNVVGPRNHVGEGVETIGIRRGTDHECARAAVQRHSHTAKAALRTILDTIPVCIHPNPITDRRRQRHRDGHLSLIIFRGVSVIRRGIRIGLVGGEDFDRVRVDAGTHHIGHKGEGLALTHIKAQCAPAIRTGIIRTFGRTAAHIGEAGRECITQRDVGSNTRACIRHGEGEDHLLANIGSRLVHLLGHSKIDQCRQRIAHRLAGLKAKGRG